MARQTNKRLLILGLIASVVIILIAIFRAPAVIEKILDGSTFYLRSKIYSLSKSFDWQDNKNNKNSKSDADRMSKQVADLLLKVAQLQSVERENQELRMLANYQPSPVFKKVTARIIGKDPTLDNSIILDRGSQSGLKSGLGVVAHDGVIVGKIIDTSLYFSTALLLTDPQVKISLARSGEVKAIAITEGQYGLSITANYIPQTEKIEIGDLLVTAGLDSLVPAGLVVGNVNRIISEENDLFKKVSLVPPLDVEGINMVGVLIPAQQ